MRVQVGLLAREAATCEKSSEVVFLDQLASR